MDWTSSQSPTADKSLAQLRQTENIYCNKQFYAGRSDAGFSARKCIYTNDDVKHFLMTRWMLFKSRHLLILVSSFSHIKRLTLHFYKFTWHQRNPRLKPTTAWDLTCTPEGNLDSPRTRSPPLPPPAPGRAEGLPMKPVSKHPLTVCCINTAVQ